jgi:hypothetical protein
LDAELVLDDVAGMSQCRICTARSGTACSVARLTGLRIPDSDIPTISATSRG